MQSEKNRRTKPFRIELGWLGLFTVLLVSFCLFLWMFLLGLWAGQTILLPVDGKPAQQNSVGRDERIDKNPAAITTMP